jgi:hypothetical protein
MHMDFRLGPFLVPLGAFLVAIVAIVAGVMQEAARVRLKAEQRMAMIARGMSVDDIEKLLGKKDDVPAPKDPLRTLANTRRWGIVLISSGVGLILFFVSLTWIVGEHDVLAGAAVGLIPLAVGAGFIVDYKMLKRDFSRFSLEAE